jgi:HAD superfamily hydrolase (TIGR01509 family)
MARALIFDFDGTVLDTEMAVYRGWADLYERHGVELDLELWQHTIGTDQDPDHWANLEAIVGTLDPALKEWRRTRRDEILHAEVPRPGVLRWLDDADALGIPIGIASSSPIDWVERHLDRLGLSHRFACFACCNDVIPAKPDPTSYRLACEALHADPRRSIAVEDSPHGVAAAKDAGLFVIAVPHDLTRDLDLSRADVVVDSLDGVRLADFAVELRPAHADDHE